MSTKMHSWLGILFLLVTINATSQSGPSFTMTTEKPIGSTLSFTVNYGLELSIDWGDGNIQKISSTYDPVVGTIKGTTVKVTAYDVTDLDCSEAELTFLSIAELPDLTALNCSHNNLTEIDILSNTKIRKVNASFNQLTTLALSSKVNQLTDLIVNNNQLKTLMLIFTPKIQTLICNDNQITSAPIAPLANIKTFWCHNNQLKSIIATSKLSLTSIICYNNELTSLNISGSKNLNTIWCDQNKIASLDISSLDTIEFISADKNLLNSFKSNRTVPYLYLNDNSLGLAGIPSNEAASDYVFSPQRIELPATTAQSTPIDLSEQLTLNDGSPSNAQFSWRCHEGALIEGTDYSTTNGIFTFNRAAGIAICTITTPLLPNLIVETTPTDIGQVSSLDDMQAASIKAFSRNSQLIVRSNEPQSVQIHHVSGRHIRTVDQLTGEITIDLPKGVYLVNRTKVVIY